MTATANQVQFATREPVDFVVVGTGAAGGVIAKELSTEGYDVVVLEQGRYVTANQFKRDELGQDGNRGFGEPFNRDPHSYREDDSVVAEERQVISYLRLVGGSSVNFSANYWRFHEIDFVERSVFGPIAGTGFADWPITYAELEPYYSKVEWEIGVSGAPGRHEPPRSRPYPMPPLPLKSSGALLESAAKKLGWHASPAPMAILSRRHDERAACINCGFCSGFGCMIDAKSSTLAAMIPKALASGHCEIRAESTVFRLETDDAGRIAEVIYYDRDGRERAQRAAAVVLCANGAETPRLLLMSASGRFPDGLANGSGKVGRYLMGNGQVHAFGQFEQPLNEYKSVLVSRIIQCFYDSDPARGFYGGGGIDARFQSLPIGFAENGLPPDAPTWGSQYKRMLSEYFTRTIDINGHSTTLPQETNSISLDPDLTDSFGRPAIRVTYKEHPDDIAIKEWMLGKCRELAAAMDPLRTWTREIRPTQRIAHFLGTCRMGNDPATSVIDRHHRAHEVPNLFVCDGSSLVTSGRGQPTMTIQALAFRAADHIVEFAKRGEI